jgi:hypothetical protein
MPRETTLLVERSLFNNATQQFIRQNSDELFEVIIVADRSPNDKKAVEINANSLNLGVDLIDQNSNPSQCHISPTTAVFYICSHSGASKDLMQSSSRESAEVILNSEMNESVCTEALDASWSKARLPNFRNLTKKMEILKNADILQDRTMDTLIDQIAQLSKPGETLERPDKIALASRELNRVFAVASVSHGKEVQQDSPVFLGNLKNALKFMLTPAEITPNPSVAKSAALGWQTPAKSRG